MCRHGKREAQVAFSSSLPTSALFYFPQAELSALRGNLGASMSLCDAAHQIFKLSLPSAAPLSSRTPFLSWCCYFSTRTPSSKSRLALQRTFSFLSDTNEEPLLIISPSSQKYPNINMDLSMICIFLEQLSLRVNPSLWLCLVTLPPTDSDQPLISSHPHFLFKNKSHYNFGIETTVWLNKNMFILFSLFDWLPLCFGFY